MSKIKMSKALAVIAIITLIIVLASTILTIWLEWAPKEDFLQLTEVVLSWEVITGGLVAGAGSKFGDEITAILSKLAT